MRVKFKMKDLAAGKPVPASIYRVRVKLEETTFDTGSWGAKGQFKVLEGEEANRNIFENFPLIAKDGSLSGAAFRFGQLYVGVTDEDVEVEAETPEELREQLMACIEAVNGAEVTVETSVDVDENEEYPDKARIEKYL